jgi:hypothetical protein
MKIAHTLRIFRERPDHGVFLACDAVVGSLSKPFGSLVLSLAGGAFLAPLLLEVGGCEGTSEL